MKRRLFIILAMAAMSVSLVYAHGDATHITGTITAIEGDHIQVKDQAGKTVMVMLEKTTKYLKSKAPATKADLKVGTRVLIDAKMDEKMKIKITRRESKETIHWLDLIMTYGNKELEKERLELMDEADQIRKILSAILKKLV